VLTLVIIAIIDNKKIDFSNGGKKKHSCLGGCNSKIKHYEDKEETLFI